jgi:transcriptional regulator with XRE-family HTH domain
VDRQPKTGKSNPYKDAENIRDIAATVQAKREALGWTQGKLAEEANVNEATVRVLEGGQMLPLPSTLALISAALHVSLGQAQQLS